MNDHKTIWSMDRKKFIETVNHFTHPSDEISNPDQLKGREKQLSELRDVFDTTGSHAIIWGLRGVGKTSLVHTACEKYSESVRLAAAVSCERNSTFSDLMNDVFRRVVNDGKISVKSKDLKVKLAAFGFAIEGGLWPNKEKIEIQSVNSACDLLNTIFQPDYEKGRIWVIIIDEFDMLKNQSTFDSFTSLAKQISVDKLPVKFLFCGVAANLKELMASHESSDRYLRAIELPELPSNVIMEIVEYIAINFFVKFNKGQIIRIAQIACGYPHFAHVIMREVLVVGFDSGTKPKEISDQIFKDGVQKAARSAATRLLSAYEDATKKGTDRYIEVLWSVAKGQLLEKQFKSVFADYQEIMNFRTQREILTEQTFRNHLNSLSNSNHGSVINHRKPGWYSFSDPMFRSYVRMMAHNSDVDLGDESFSR